MGTQRGRYELLMPLASGGMGAVHLGRVRGAHGFEREVAIKVMHPHLRHEGSFALDLLEEGKLTVQIRHPNVVSVLDIVASDDDLQLVMEYVEGDSLWGLGHVRSDGIPPALGLRILLDALAGLHAAHELKDLSGAPVALVHRDVSPQNILVGLDGIGRLTDFGVAKAANRIATTSSGIIKGKIAYMSPEQARGEPIDRRCDIWAAGVIAWELVARRRLHAVGEEAATLFKVATASPPRLSTILDHVPAAVDEAIARALANDDRWPTAAAFRNALLRACHETELWAEQEEVSAWVTRAIGTRLKARRAKLASISMNGTNVLTHEQIAELKREMLEAQPRSRPSMPEIRTDISAAADVAPRPVKKRTPFWPVALAGIGCCAALAVGAAMAGTKEEHARSAPMMIDPPKQAAIARADAPTPAPLVLPSATETRVATPTPVPVLVPVLHAAVTTTAVATAATGKPRRAPTSTPSPNAGPPPLAPFPGDP